MNDDENDKNNDPESIKIGIVILLESDSGRCSLFQSCCHHSVIVKVKIGNVNLFSILRIKLDYNPGC